MGADSDARTPPRRIAESRYILFSVFPAFSYNFWTSFATVSYMYRVHNDTKGRRVPIILLSRMDASTLTFGHASTASSVGTRSASEAGFKLGGSTAGGTKRTPRTPRATTSQSMPASARRFGARYERPPWDESFMTAGSTSGGAVPPILRRDPSTQLLWSSGWGAQGRAYYMEHPKGVGESALGIPTLVHLFRCLLLRGLNTRVRVPLACDRQGDAFRRLHNAACERHLPADGAGLNRAGARSGWNISWTPATASATSTNRGNGAARFRTGSITKI